MTERNVKQVIVMRKDLNMRKGKMAAQAAHAAMIFLIDQATIIAQTEEDYGFGQVLNPAEAHWLRESFTKVVVGVDSEEELFEIHQKALDAGLTSHVVRDAGYTEFAGVPTYTCLAIGPADSNEINAITGHLKLL
jgi:peptidyl-tRNA hydrolase, PTH2 family